MAEGARQYGKNLALPKKSLLSMPRTRGAIPNWRSTPTLQYSITPRGRIRGRDDDEDENEAPLYFTAPAVIPRISCREKII
jgi:hypothetical protein